MSSHMSVWCQALVWLALAASISSKWITVWDPKNIKTTTVSTYPTTQTTTPLPYKADSRYIKEIYPYGFAVPSPELCPNQGAGLQLMILVTSAIPDRELRDGVRKSWANYSNLRKIAVGFLLGKIDELDKYQIEKIKAEKSLHEDLIIGNFQDAYTNLTLKSMAMLEWATTYCSKVPKIMKVDDDVFINIPQLISFINHPERINETNMIYGSWTYNKVNRNLFHKHYVSYDQYPFNEFPIYVAGSAYMMTSDAAKKLLHALPNERYVSIEDAFITGVVADALQIHKEYAKNFLLEHVPDNKKSICTSMKYIGTHMIGQNVLNLKRHIQHALKNAECIPKYYELYRQQS